MGKGCCKKYLSIALTVSQQQYIEKKIEYNETQWKLDCSKGNNF